MNNEITLTTNALAAVGKALDKPPVKPTPNEHGFFKCQFCGCQTNAKLRWCCRKGYEEDRKEKPVCDECGKELVFGMGEDFVTEALPCPCQNKEAE